jgi:hypothetical protein
MQSMHYLVTIRGTEVGLNEVLTEREGKEAFVLHKMPPQASSKHHHGMARKWLQLCVVCSNSK